LIVEGGERTFEGSCGMAPGTMILCRDLFYNVPARYKFLRSDASEAGAIAGIAGKIALTRPDVSFRLERNDDGRELLYTPGDNQLLSAIYAVFGQETASAMQALSGDDPPVKITGFMTGPSAGRHNRSRQVFIVNDRVIQSPVLRSAVDEACKTWFMKGRYPQLVLKLVIPPNLVDVNVHPQKTEIRFWEDRAVFRAVFHTVRAALEEQAKIVQSSPVQETEKRASQDARSRQVEMRPAGSLWPDQPSGESHASGQAGTGLTIEDGPARADKTAVKERDEDIASLLDARLIGTLLDTYILLDDGQSLILIDQHAAHERILYEELLKKRAEKGGLRAASQLLMTPLRVEVNEQERVLLEEEPEHFKLLGFDFEPFGEHTIALRAVPVARPDGRSTMDSLAAFRAALDAMTSARQTGSIPDDDEILHQIACKAAVKAHDRLSEEEIRILIQALTALANPYHCPHGRPAVLRFSRQDLEKRFGRIV
ncbi:MAG TPA: DNA mismatch repair endonuclease MutL, partial [Bacillota bacterium]|nr:DNA mismatch repair endonuclease MutL [Bacillota bacterium]